MKYVISQIFRCTLVLLTIFSLCVSADAALLSSTQSQTGIFATEILPPTPTGRLVKLGTFSFLPDGYASFTSVRLFAAVRSAGVDPLKAPRLFFTAPNTPVVGFYFGPAPIQTDLIVLNSTTDPVVEILQTAWISLSPLQGSSIAALMNNNAGQIDAWLYGNMNPEFHAPDQTVTFVDPFPSTSIEKYSATIQFEAVPEPASAVSLLVAMAGVVHVIGRRFKSLKRSKI